ncbi:unnamed protein product [Allacma fusca]|uniref:Deoxynucleotidyltransferase terminal-interacting protein 1 n=1 Tax=Allacma fusca TaxID=39272 RepID=A0A8J2PZD6_9HEXA|nr:unnamed protein product [Allacma fusca]
MVIDAAEQEGLPSTEWSPFNMRQYNLSILKPPLSKSAGSSSSKASMSYTSAAKSLDLLRQNLQRSINTEIQTVISRYLEVYFKPGIENIKNNLGPDAVTEDHIQNMCRQILEEAKRMFPVYSSSSPSSCNTSSAIDQIDSDYQSSQNNSSNANDGVKLPLTSPSFGIKRESDTDSEASSMSNASKKLKKSGNSKSGAAGSASSTANNTNNNNTTSTNSSASPNKPKKPSGPSRKHVAQWDANKLTPDTLFIMGAKANKALGFAQTRGRLYVKHPGLFKYASDSDDKEWLSKNKLMPATGGRAYIMLLEDIEKLAKDNKLNVTINYEDIKGFRVPDFILNKMKSYITTWKKQYAEEAQRSAASAKANRNQNQQQNNLVNVNHVSTSMPSTTTTNTNNNLTQLNPPPPPLPIQHNQAPPPPLQHPNPHNQQSLNSYHINPPANVIFEPSLMPLTAAPQPHEMTDMREYIHMEKPPPMYPGHSGQPPQQQHTMPQMQNPNPGGYVHTSNHMDPIEQALSKGDWSNVSDRSLLQYALQSTRNMGSWDPQDSFDLIDSVTNGSLTGGGNIGENSPLLQISPDAGAHLTAPPMGPVSPNCELSAVLDQAFQYTDTCRYSFKPVTPV